MLCDTLLVAATTLGLRSGEKVFFSLGGGEKKFSKRGERDLTKSGEK